MITDEVVEALLRKRTKKERVWEDGEAPLRERREETIRGRIRKDETVQDRCEEGIAGSKLKTEH